MTHPPVAPDLPAAGPAASGAAAIGRAPPFGLMDETTRNLLQAAHEGIVMIDARQRIVALNPAAERLLGLPARQALGQPLMQFIPDRYRARHAENVERFVGSQALQQRMAGGRAVTVLRADGTEVRVDVVLSRVDVATPAGVDHYYAALLLDQSQTVALEGQLRDERERLRLVFDLAPVALWVVENDAIVFANREAMILLGQQAKQAVLGRSVYSLLRPESHGALRRQVKRVISGDTASERVRASLAHSSGSWHEVELALAALPDHGRTLVQMVVADVTRREQEAQALERSRQDLRELSANLVQAREDERRRIARELHDELGQRLTALKLDLSTLDRPGAGPCAAQMQPMLTMLDETMAAVRRLAADLRPMLLDDLGLNAAVQWLAGDAARRLGLQVKVSLDEQEPDLAEPAATALYRIVQEALTNVARHAKASEVAISLRRVGGEMVLDVHDNGIGLPPGVLQRQGSFGLMGIHERVLALGGTLEVNGQGGGTRLTVRLPVPSPPAAPAGGSLTPTGRRSG